MSYNEYREKSHKNAQSRVKAHGGMPGRATGGKVGHPDVMEDRKVIKEMVKPSALTGRADGGRAPKGQHKGKTQVNVVVAPRGEDRPVPVPVPNGVGPAGPAPMPSRPVPPPAMPVAAGAPNIGNLPARPMGAKSGGKVSKRAAGGKVHMEYGAGSGPGRLEKIEEYGKNAGVRKTK